MKPLLPPQCLLAHVCPTPVVCHQYVYQADPHTAMSSYELKDLVGLMALGSPPQVPPPLKYTSIQYYYHRSLGLVFVPILAFCVFHLNPLLDCVPLAGRTVSPSSESRPSVPLVGSFDLP